MGKSFQITGSKKKKKPKGDENVALTFRLKYTLKKRKSRLHQLLKEEVRKSMREN